MFRFLGSCGGLHCCGLRPNIYSGIGIKCVKYFSSNNIVTNQARYNALNIQMLSKSLHEQIFGHHISDADNEQIDNSIEHLTKHNLYGRPISMIPDVDFKLPPLRGSNIEEHFKVIAEEQTRSYFEMAERLSRVSLPSRPKEWSFEPGWTKYDGDLMVGMPVECPDGDVMVFDVEVCVNEGQFPTMAVLATPGNWYSWVSHRLVEERSYQWFLHPKMHDLIPLESSEQYQDDIWQEKLIIGHSVGYDRSFVKEQYLIKGPKTYFLDTLSLHMCISGLTGLQRNMMKAASVGKSEHENWMDISCLNNLRDTYQLYCGGKELDKEKRNIFVHGTLDDVKEQFQDLMTYCSNDVLSTHEVFCQMWPLFLERFPHPVTFAGMLEMSVAYLPVNQSWEKYIADCENTYEDLEKEMKSSLMRLADNACHLLHHDQYKNDLWLWNLDWSVQDLRIKKAKPPKKGRKKKQQEEDEMKDDNKNKVENDNEDDIEDIIARIPLAEDVLYKKRQHMPGYPLWYRKLCPRMDSDNWRRGAVLVSAQCRVAASLLRMTWDGYPLHYDSRHGWGYLVPGRTTNLSQDECEHFPRRAFEELGQHLKDRSDNKAKILAMEDEEYVEELSEGQLWSSAEENVLTNKVSSKGASSRNRTKVLRKQDAPDFHHGVGPFNDVNLPGVWFFRIPHKDGEKFKCGNPLAKDYISKMEDGTLKSEGDEGAERTLMLNKMISYWRNAKRRITSQLYVWLDKNYLPNDVINSSCYTSDDEYGAILPRFITAGTVTRRAVEPTWMTASNPRVDRVGSELKAFIRAPPGYCFVGADVDSQELWIAALLGDANFAKTHGNTAFGWMTLQGKRAEGTDLHSKTAETIGITREHAKIFNYGRIYGAGVNFAEKLLLQFNHRLTENEARSKAEKLYASTKGIQRHRLSEYGQKIAKKYKYEDLITEDGFLDSKSYYQLLKVSRRFRNQNKEMSLYKEWQEGSESQMFNMLESIAQSEEPETPVLGCKISRALEPNIVGNKFITSRINWVVQSSAVDYLHLMLVCMKWLFTECVIEGRFCISIHDEVRYLVNSKDRYRAALALQITNLLTRSMFAYKLGINDLPQSVAFFSEVDIDLVIRKEVTMDCKTPSNPRGFTKSYGIPEGEALDIYEILQQTNNGCLEKKRKTTRISI